MNLSDILSERLAIVGGTGSGTLGCLRFYHSEIERHTSRIERAVETLTGII